MKTKLVLLAAVSSLLVVFASMMTSCDAKAQKQSIDLERYMLKGQVKDVVCQMTELIKPDPKAVRDEYSSNESGYSNVKNAYGFDEKGNLIYANIGDYYQSKITVISDIARKVELKTRYDERTFDYTYMVEPNNLSIEGGGKGDSFSFDAQRRVLEFFVGMDEPVFCVSCAERQITYSYNGDAFLPVAATEYVNIGGDGITYEFTIEYPKIDKHGNWLVRICTDKTTKKPVYKEERTITYYE